MIHPIITVEEIGQLIQRRRAASWEAVRQIRDCYGGSAQLRRKGAVLTKDFADWFGLDLADVYAFLTELRKQS